MIIIRHELVSDRPVSASSNSLKVPLNAFMTVRCTEVGCTLRIKCSVSEAGFEGQSAKLAEFSY